MTKTIYDHYDKSLIATLPTAAFEGRIEVVLTPAQAERAVGYLLRQDILGMDTETRPSFTRGRQHHVSLLQVSSRDICFLFRLRHTGMAPAIVRLLEDEEVNKVGLSWHDDLAALQKLARFKMGRYTELQQHVSEIGIEDLSLQKLYANMFGQRISKRQQLSNWDADILNDKQKLYAATDAWACIMLYEELCRLKESGDYVLVKREQ